MRRGLPEYLIDSNVLIYAYDAAETSKQERALQVLDRLIGERNAAVSVQCLGEFYNAATRRIPEPLSSEVARSEVERYSRDCAVLEVTKIAVLDACRGSVEHQVSYWDALIWSTARLNDISIIVTEDGQDGRLIEGVRYLNPFRADFDLKSLEV